MGDRGGGGVCMLVNYGCGDGGHKEAMGFTH